MELDELCFTRCIVCFHTQRAIMFLSNQCDPLQPMITLENGVSGDLLQVFCRQALCADIACFSSHGHRAFDSSHQTASRCLGLYVPSNLLTHQITPSIDECQARITKKYVLLSRDGLDCSKTRTCKINSQCLILLTTTACVIYACLLARTAGQISN